MTRDQALAIVERELMPALIAMAVSLPFEIRADELKRHHDEIFESVVFGLMDGTIPRERGHLHFDLIGSTGNIPNPRSN